MKNVWKILAAVAGTFVLTSLGWWALTKNNAPTTAEHTPKAIPVAMPVAEPTPEPAAAPPSEPESVPVAAKPATPKSVANTKAAAKVTTAAAPTDADDELALPRPMPKSTAIKTDATGTLISLEARPERYLTNPTLEQYVGKGSQASDMTIAVQSPANGSHLRLRDGYADLLFRGTVTSKTSPDGLCYYKIYPNNERDFNLDRAIYRESIRFVGNGDKHDFEWNARVALPRGVYYVVMEKKVSNEILHVSKIVIE